MDGTDQQRALPILIPLDPGDTLRRDKVLIWAEYMKRVGLVLGSGGARGWAHIGVIRALEAAHIRVHSIAGASIGALVGAIYSAGELDDLEEFIRSLDWKAVVSFFDVVFPSSGLLDGNRVYELLSEHLQQMTIEQAEIEFCCVATDLTTGQEVRLQTGPMVDAVRASISIPGVFTPFQQGERFLGDGGIVNPMPVDVMQTMGAEVVIAVNLNRSSPSESLTASVRESLDQETHDPQAPDEPRSDPQATNPCQNLRSSASDRVPSLIERVRQRYESIQDQIQEKMENWLPEQKQGLNIFDVIGTSLNVMEQQVTQSKLNAHPPDLLVEPDLAEYGIFDFHQADAIIEAGYQAMSQRIPDLFSELADVSSE